MNSPATIIIKRNLKNLQEAFALRGSLEKYLNHSVTCHFTLWKEERNIWNSEANGLKLELTDVRFNKIIRRLVEMLDKGYIVTATFYIKPDRNN